MYVPSWVQTHTQLPTYLQHTQSTIKQTNETRNTLKIFPSHPQIPSNNRPNLSNLRHFFMAHRFDPDS